MDKEARSWIDETLEKPTIPTRGLVTRNQAEQLTQMLDELLSLNELRREKHAKRRSDLIKKYQSMFKISDEPVDEAVDFSEYPARDDLPGDVTKAMTTLQTQLDSEPLDPYFEMAYRYCTVTESDKIATYRAEEHAPAVRALRSDEQVYHMVHTEFIKLVGLMSRPLAVLAQRVRDFYDDALKTFPDQSEVDALRETIDGLEEDVIVLNSTVLQRDRAIADLKTDVGDLKHELTCLTQDHEERGAAIGRLKGEIIEAERSAVEAGERAEQASHMRAMVERDNEAKQRQLAQQNTHSYDLHMKYEEALEDIEQKERVLKEMDTECDRLEDMLDDADGVEKTMKAQFASIQTAHASEAARMRIELDGLDADLRGAHDTIAGLKREVDSLRELEAGPNARDMQLKVPDTAAAGAMLRTMDGAVEYLAHGDLATVWGSIKADYDQLAERGDRLERRLRVMLNQKAVPGGRLVMVDVGLQTNVTSRRTPKTGQLSPTKKVKGAPRRTPDGMGSKDKDKDRDLTHPRPVMVAESTMTDPPPPRPTGVTISKGVQVTAVPLLHGAMFTQSGGDSSDHSDRGRARPSPRRRHAIDPESPRKMSTVDSRLLPENPMASASLVDGSSLRRLPSVPDNGGLTSVGEERGMLLPEATVTGGTGTGQVGGKPPLERAGSREKSSGGGGFSIDFTSASEVQPGTSAAVPSPDIRTLAAPSLFSDAERSEIDMDQRTRERRARLEKNTRPKAVQTDAVRMKQRGSQTDTQPDPHDMAGFTTVASIAELTEIRVGLGRSGSLPALLSRASNTGLIIDVEGPMGGPMGAVTPISHRTPLEALSPAINGFFGDTMTQLTELSESESDLESVVSSEVSSVGHDATQSVVTEMTQTDTISPSMRPSTLSTVLAPTDDEGPTSTPTMTQTGSGFDTVDGETQTIMSDDDGDGVGEELMASDGENGQGVAMASPGADPTPKSSRPTSTPTPPDDVSSMMAGEETDTVPPLSPTPRSPKPKSKTPRRTHKQKFRPRRKSLAPTIPKTKAEANALCDLLLTYLGGRAHDLETLLMRGVPSPRSTYPTVRFIDDICQTEALPDTTPASPRGAGAGGLLPTLPPSIFPSPRASYLVTGDYPVGLMGGERLVEEKSVQTDEITGYTRRRVGPARAFMETPLAPVVGVGVGVGGFDSSPYRRDTKPIYRASLTSVEEVSTQTMGKRSWNVRKTLVDDDPHHTSPRPAPPPPIPTTPPLNAWGGVDTDVDDWRAGLEAAVAPHGNDEPDPGSARRGGAGKHVIVLSDRPRPARRADLSPRIQAKTKGRVGGPLMNSPTPAPAQDPLVAIRSFTPNPGKTLPAAWRHVPSAAELAERAGQPLTRRRPLAPIVAARTHTTPSMPMLDSVDVVLAGHGVEMMNDRSPRRGSPTGLHPVTPRAYSSMM